MSVLEERMTLQIMIGYYQYECPRRENDIANYAKTNEEMLLMTYVDEAFSDLPGIGIIMSKRHTLMKYKKGTRHHESDKGKY